MYIVYIYQLSKKKKKKNLLTCFLWELSLGLNSSLSSPTSEQVCLKRGGGARSTDGSSLEPDDDIRPEP